MDYQNLKIFDAEAEKLVEGLRMANCMSLLDFETENSNCEEAAVAYNLKELAVSDVLTCSYCSVSFPDASHQRTHYKLDWHRYNLKRALCGNKSVPEEVFNSLADDVSSISGSDSDRSEDSDTESSEPIKNVSTDNVEGKVKSIRHAKAFFENNENKILSVYKCLLHNKKETPAKEEMIKRVYDLIKQPKKWMIILLGGGHFASAIFSDGEILSHKTFHCYTVRAKQGGSQSSRDNKGGGHPKSAGASLRCYNEQALVQHVQEIVSSWSELIKQCGLILYRATGPYNRGVLFGGKNPPLSKTDQRLRNIPFPTRRATFKEVKRVYEMLSSIEIYGLAENFKNKFPPSPDKRTWSPKSKREKSHESDQVKKEDESGGKKERQSKSNKTSGQSPHREITQENPEGASCESEDEEEVNFELVSTDITVSFHDLEEFGDTVPQHIKDLKRKKSKKLSSKQKAKLERRKWTDEFEKIQGNLVKSCETENKELLIEYLNIYSELPERSSNSVQSKKPSSVFTKEDFIDCLNSPIDEESRNTLLHLVSSKGLPEFVTILLTSGADPSIKNKNKLTPYVIGDKEARNSFRLFASQFPDKYDYKKANIPEPLSEEQERELEEKKKEKKKLKRVKEKIKKQEEKQKKNEEEEKKKFLALSDREKVCKLEEHLFRKCRYIEDCEMKHKPFTAIFGFKNYGHMLYSFKCALAAERRLISSSSSNLKSTKPPVLSRCFQCGVDITGIIAFEYGYNRFCTVACLKAHRLKTNSYGKEI